MKKVILESPYAGNVKENTKYAKACIRDCLKRGEAPIASHLLYTQEGILNDNVSTERALGITAGLVWSDVADYVVVYTDRGITKGMKLAIETHKRFGTKVEYRTILKHNSYEPEAKSGKK